MLARFRPRRPSHTTVAAYSALFIALGGSAYAAATIGTAQLKNGAVTNPKLATNAVGTGKVIDRSLLAQDFKAGELSSGEPWRGFYTGSYCVSPGQYCSNENSDFTYNVWRNRSETGPNAPFGDPAYTREAGGVVRLKGLARCRLNVGGTCHDKGLETVLRLPVGFRPPERLVLVAHADYAPRRLDVTDDGYVLATAADDYLSLGGISFRCGPVGQNGCK